jgi:hypothetical protein
LVFICHVFSFYDSSGEVAHISKNLIQKALR